MMIIVIFPMHMPIHKLPPNALQSHRLNSGEHFPAEELPTNTEYFEFHTEVFDKISTKVIHKKCRNWHFGLLLNTDDFYNRVHVEDAHPNSSISKTHKTKRDVNKSIKGSFLTEIDGKPVFSQDEATAESHRLHREKTQTFEIEFAPERELTGRDKVRADFVVLISIFSMPRCLDSESPSRVSTGFHVIVVFLASDRSFVLDFVRGCFLTCP